MITQTTNKSAHAKIKRELDGAARLDPDLKALIKELGYPPPRSRAPGFATLLQTICSQQLSAAAAQTIWLRLKKLCKGEITVRKILNRTPAQLKKCGLSSRKIEYAKVLAKMVAAKEINLTPKLNSATDTENLITELCKIRGIGRWSAEIYLMFALGHPDIFPSGDLALQVAVQRYKGLKKRPDEKTTAKLAAKWTPHRSSVAILMWRYYRSTPFGEAAAKTA